MLDNLCGCWSCSEIVTALSQVDLGIEELRAKKDKIKKVMQLEEEEKANIQRELAALTQRLAVIDASLSEKYAYVDAYDKTIQDVESTYSKWVHGPTTVVGPCTLCAHFYHLEFNVSCRCDQSCPAGKKTWTDEQTF